jgi:hypothetical protein
MGADAVRVVHGHMPGRLPNVRTRLDDIQLSIATCRSNYVNK